MPFSLSAPQSEIIEPEYYKDTQHNGEAYSMYTHQAGNFETSPQPFRERRKVGCITIPSWSSPEMQLVMVSFVCFLCPGMFNALNGLGAAGQFDTTLSNDANCALYSTFAVVGFFAGTVTNTLGVKTALGFGGIGYSIYVSSYLCYNHTKNHGFVVFAGALLGACAGILWSAQGAIMMSYPPERLKGRYISWFWAIFNLGAVIGSVIVLGLNLDPEKPAISNVTYIVFILLTFLGALLSWSLVDANRVVRNDGSTVILMRNPTWTSELLGLYQTLRDDPYVILLFPMFFASNWFYTYQFQDVNHARFTTRTRALNDILYWVAQMAGAFIVGCALDFPHIRRTTRAKIAWVVMFALTCGVWGGGYVFQRQYTRESAKRMRLLDWDEEGYVGPLLLYVFYGFYDAAWQTCVYWFMGAISNSSRKLANLAGFYKGIQSAGAGIMWRLDGQHTPYMNLFTSCWALLAGSLVVALPVMIGRIRDSVPVEEDLKFTDVLDGDGDEIGFGVGMDLGTGGAKVAR